ncbi:MAG: H-type small acid-soluble spore protein [Bacillaceae bacterium]|nr:H-type small acid-soluble spore protein [Bacillaceae bacterium]
MDVSRAQEILQSREKIDVYHQNTPVWIDEVNQADRTARVHDETNPAEQKTVPVQELEEGINH